MGDWTDFQYVEQVEEAFMLLLSMYPVIYSWFFKKLSRGSTFQSQSPGPGRRLIWILQATCSCQNHIMIVKLTCCTNILRAYKLPGTHDRTYQKIMD